MPTVREQISDQVLALLEGDADVRAFFTRSGNRTRVDQPGWLRDRMIARAPADFPRFSFDFDGGTHSMWTRATDFAADSPNFHEMVSAGLDVEVDRTFDLTVTIRDRLPPAGEVYAPEEPIMGSLFRAGTRLGLPDIVLSVGVARFTRRDTREGEEPRPGTVTLVRLPITTRESGRNLL